MIDRTIWLRGGGGRGGRIFFHQRERETGSEGSFFCPFWAVGGVRQCGW
jgi:hypothetical protein